MSFYKTEPPDSDLDHEPEDKTRFPCACGDLNCIGFNDDAQNIRIGGAWYASSCVMANSHPHVVRLRELDAFNHRDARRI